MADATNRPPVQTPKPQRDDLQRLIPDNVRLRRALEQLFIDVNQTLPDAVQQVGDNSQAVTEDVSMGVFGATDRRTARTLADLAEALDRSDAAIIKKLSARIDALEGMLFDSRPNLSRYALLSGANFTNTVRSTRFLTSSNTAASTSGTPVTVFSIPNAIPGAYLIHAAFDFTSNDTSDYGAFAVVVSDGSSARIALSNNGALQTITLSGLNVQTTQSSGGSQTVRMNITKVA